MSTEDVDRARKVAAREGELLQVYRRVYPVLSAIERIGLPPAVLAALDRLRPPERMAPAQAVAVLKGIRGSTDADYFPFEVFFGRHLPDGTTLGQFVGDRLEELGLGYHDLYPYLEQHGLLKELPGPG